MLKVAIFNFKGGTGKSTTALNLGASLATSKRKVLLIDLDGQRTLSFGLGLDGQQPTAKEWLTEGKVSPLTICRALTFSMQPAFFKAIANPVTQRFLFAKTPQVFYGYGKMRVVVSQKSFFNQLLNSGRN